MRDPFTTLGLQTHTLEEFVLSEDRTKFLENQIPNSDSYKFFKYLMDVHSKGKTLLTNKSDSDFL